MKPFLLLATRAHDDVADDEYQAVLRACRLRESQLVRIRLEQRPLGPVDLDDWSGVIVGGSPFNVSDPPEVKSAIQQRVEAEIGALLTRCVATDFPFLGACYGIGSLTAQQGGVVDRTYGERVAAVTIAVTEVGREDPIFGQLPPQFDAFVAHKEAVTVLPASAVTVATSANCPVQAMRVGTAVYATQYHPELDAGGLGMRVDAYRDQGYFRADEVEQVKAMARAANVDHAGQVLAAFCDRFTR